MAMRVPGYERNQVVQAVKPVGVAQAQSGFGQVAKGLADVGGMFDQWQADVDEADAKGADTDYAKLVRDTLYNPDTGYLNASGGTAMTSYKQVSETLQNGMNTRLEGLSGPAREMAQRSMQGALDGALLKVDAHAGDQRLVYLDGQSKARVQSAIDDAIIDPTNFTRSLGVMRAEVRDQAARGGWSPEQTEAALKAGESDMHSGLVSRLSSVDPIQALDYLNAHRDQMGAEVVVKLEAALVPEAKRRRGANFVRQSYQTRMTGQVPESYYGNARAAESGGNDAARNPTSSATGRYQFIKSTWDGLIKRRPDLGLTADGRTDPAQQERAMRAFTEENARTLIRGGVAITNGTLYAAHFLGAGGALKVLSAPMGASVADIVGQGVVSANKFLAGMKVSDFVAWAERKGGGQAPSSGAQSLDLMSQIIAMEDPDERAAALQEYELMSGHIAAQQKARQEAAREAALAMIDQGGSVDDLTPDQKADVGYSYLSTLRENQAKVAAGRAPVTDPAVYVELFQQMNSDPEAFKARELMSDLNNLSRSDFNMFVQNQADMMKPEKAPKPDAAVTVSTINTVTGDLLKAAGVDEKKAKGAGQKAQLQESLLRWTQQFQADNSGRAPTQLEIRDRANQMLMPVIIDPPGAWNEVSGKSFEIDFDAVTPQDIRDGTLKIGDTTIPSETVTAFVTAFEAAMGRAPTPQEVVEGLVYSMTP